MCYESCHVFTVLGTDSSRNSRKMDDNSRKFSRNNVVNNNFTCYRILVSIMSLNRVTSFTTRIRYELLTARQVRVCNVKYVLDLVNRRDGYSMKKQFRSSTRGTSFHTKDASNANVGRVVLLDANSYLALWYLETFYVLF
jgi:hypothetical protein